MALWHKQVYAPLQTPEGRALDIHSDIQRHLIHNTAFGTDTAKLHFASIL
jgi:hypothetical protein